jgi:hypothetical protein
MTTTWEVPDDLDWHMLPRDDGQIVEVTYACDEYYLYCRTYDRSDRTTSYQRAEWGQDDIRFEPWNGILPTHGDWENQ